MNANDTRRIIPVLLSASSSAKPWLYKQHTQTLGAGVGKPLP